MKAVVVVIFLVRPRVTFTLPRWTLWELCGVYKPADGANLQGERTSSWLLFKTWHTFLTFSCDSLTNHTKINQFCQRQSQHPGSTHMTFMTSLVCLEVSPMCQTEQVGTSQLSSRLTRTSSVLITLQRLLAPVCGRYGCDPFSSPFFCQKPM